MRLNVPNAEQITFQISDQIELAGIRVYSNRARPKAKMILIHGIGGRKEQLLSFASFLSGSGVESILFDGRAHGQSGGLYCTYGFNEKFDVNQIVEAISSHEDDTPIGIWGRSLGGAIALQAMEIQPNIRFGIVESTFTDLHEVVYDYQKRMSFGLGLRWFSEYALDRAGHIAQFMPNEVRPIKSAQHIVNPVLISHGDSDQRISVSHGQELFTHLGSKQKELIIVENAGHLNLHQIGGSAYYDKVMNFIEACIDSSSINEGD